MNPLLRKLTNIWGRGAVTLEIPPSVQMTWPELIREVVAQAPLSDSPIHGEKHWRSVAKTAFLISDLTGHSDKASLLGLALFHDSRRFFNIFPRLKPGDFQEGQPLVQLSLQRRADALPPRS